MLDTAIPAAQSSIDTLLLQAQEKMSTRLEIELNFMIFKLMIGFKCQKLRKEDITIRAAISTINLFTFLEVFKTQIRDIHPQSKESILILKI